MTRKLIIQIPCYNEGETLTPTLESLPRLMPGFDKVEWLVVDDGSTDNTVEIARRLGVDHIVRHNRNRGLARAFTTALSAALDAGADAIVNTDGDNQYNADDIPALLAPITAGRADIVIGTRPVNALVNYGPGKRLLHRIGRTLMRLVTGADIQDPPSGFRAFSREAAEQVNIFGGYTHTLETILQAAAGGLTLASVPVRVNGPLRSSRLIRNLPSYVLNTAASALRTALTYHPGTAFLASAVVFGLAGVAIGLRFLYFFFTVGGAGHVQSLILCALLIGLGGLMLVMGVLADLMAVNRRLLENLHRQIRRR